MNRYDIQNEVDKVSGLIMDLIRKETLALNETLRYMENNPEAEDIDGAHEDAEAFQASIKAYEFILEQIQEL